MAKTKKDLIEQSVRVEFTVRLEATEKDLNGVTLDGLQDRIVEWVKSELLGKDLASRTTDIHLSRSPGGYRYWPAVSRNGGWANEDKRAERPVEVTLADLGF